MSEYNLSDCEGATGCRGPFFQCNILDAEDALLITLVKAEVFKYKSIEDSSPVQIGDGVTVLVGKNSREKLPF